MHCKQARDLLLTSLDHALPPGEHDAVRAHLAECQECGRFAEAMQHWSAPAHYARHGPTPDLTERVLAHVRPLPPPWVYRQMRQSKQAPQVVVFIVGALGVALAFLMLCLTLIVGLAGNTPAAASHERRLFVPEVWQDVQRWFNTLPNDTTHALITLVLASAFLFLVVAWFRTLAVHVGRGRD